VAATLFFVVAAVLALYPKSTKTVTTILVVFGALALLVAGIIGAFVGERNMEHHSDQQQEAPAATEGAAPAVTVVLPGPLGSA